MRPRDKTPPKFARSVARVTGLPRHWRISDLCEHGTAAPDSGCALVADDEQFIRAKLQRHIATGGLRRQDVDDLVQMILMHLSRRLRGFRPARGRRQAYVNRLIGNFAAKVLSARRAKMRRAARIVPLHESLAYSVDHDNTDLVLDFSIVLAKLPSELRKIAESRRLGYSTAEIARIQGVHRSTINRRTKTLAELLRPRFGPDK